MSREALYQLFRRIPNADDASIDAAVDALAGGEQVATKSDLVELRTEMCAGFGLMRWMSGILTALVLGTLWMLFGITERLARLDERMNAMEAIPRTLGG